MPRRWRQTLYRVRIDLSKVKADPPRKGDKAEDCPFARTLKRRGLVQQVYPWWQADGYSLLRVEEEAVVEVVWLGRLWRYGEEPDAAPGVVPSTMSLVGSK